MSAEALNELDKLNAAARAGDIDAVDAHWREFVRLLWQPMSDRVPWVMPPKDDVRA